jgi:hypothetical protein
MSEKPDYGPSLFRLLMVVRDFQDAEATYATRENTLLAQHTAAWNQMNDNILAVVGILAAVNPEASGAIAETAVRLIDLAGQIWETSNLRVKNIERFIAGLSEAHSLLPTGEGEKQNDGR